MSPFDQINRLYAFRHLEKYDLIAFVGRSRDDIMAGAYGLRRIYFGMASMFTLLLLFEALSLLGNYY